MSWKDLLLPALYRGVPFYIQGDASGGGRNVRKAEQTGGNEPSATDQGRKLRTWKIEGYVIGPNYMQERDLLLTACETAGPGVLQHPYFGTLSVLCEDYNVAQSTSDGGRAVFSMTFTEAGKQAFPIAATATRDYVKLKGESAAPLISNAYSKIKVDNQPGWSIADIMAGIQSVINAINKVMAAFEWPAAVLSQVALQLDYWAGNLADLAVAPADFADRLIELFRLLPPEMPKDSGRWDTWPGDLPAIPLTTPERIIQAENRAALTALVHRCGLIVDCEASADWELGGGPAGAAAIRDTLIDRIDATLEADNLGDDAYGAFCDLRAAVVADLNARAPLASAVLDYEVTTPSSSLIIAYDLLGSATRAAEIEAINPTQIWPHLIMEGSTVHVELD